MTYTYQWPKAMALSVFLHIFLLIAAGYLTAGLTTELSPPAEVLLEMDLVNDPADRLGNTPEVIPPDIPPVAPVNTDPPTAENPVVEAAQPAVVTTSELTMTEAAVPASATATSQSTASSTSEPASGSGSVAPVTGGGSRSGIAAPAILSKVDPVYPASARSAGLEGTAVLRIQILPSGRPGEISIDRSTGHSSLDEAAIAAVAKWRFVPAKDRSSGKTVACVTKLPVSFRLH